MVHTNYYIASHHIFLWLENQVQGDYAWRDSCPIPASSRKIMTLGHGEITWMMGCDAQPLSYSPGLSSAFITIHRVPARIAIRLGTVYFSNKDTFTHKMQVFWEHRQHDITIYRVKVNTIRMICMVEWDFQEVGDNQPSWTDSTLCWYIFWGGTMAPYVTELYIAN